MCPAPEAGAGGGGGGRDGGGGAGRRLSGRKASMQSRVLPDLGN